MHLSFDSKALETEIANRVLRVIVSKVEPKWLKTKTNFEENKVINFT